MFKLGLATAVDILEKYDLLSGLPPINLGRGPGVSGTARIVVVEGIISVTERFVCRVVSITTPVLGFRSKVDDKRNNIREGRLERNWSPEDICQCLSHEESL